jgi:ankyrin repeat protein
MSHPLSLAEAKELIQLCEAGRLYEVEAWIRAGRSIAVPAEIRKTPLKVAIATGFHSLIELLLRHEESQKVKNDSLQLALQHDRLALIELTLAHGAEIAAVPLLDVLLTGHRAIVATFLEHGADPLTGFPFARALCQLRAKTTLGSYLDCRRLRPELGPQLQEQADMALRQFCQEGNLKWVSLLMWAGADPRTRGPAVDDAEHIDDADWHTTALNEACASGKVELLKRLKPNSSDDLAGMLDRASFSAHRDVLAYLLSLGANPNDRPDGGSTALESCIRHLGWEDFDRVRYGYGPTYQSPAHTVSNGREAIKLLLKHGAIWKPQPSTLNDTRRILYRLEPEVTVELVGQLLKTANGESGVRELLRVPRMRQHLASCASHLSRLGLTLDGQWRSDRQAAQPASSATPAHDRERLFVQVWSEPMNEVGRKYGMSEENLATLCRKLEIPTPPRGYWARKTTAQAQSPRPKLLPLGFRKRQD